MLLLSLLVLLLLYPISVGATAVRRLAPFQKSCERDEKEELDGKLVRRLLSLVALASTQPISC
jgi:hypothetical protein